MAHGFKRSGRERLVVARLDETERTIVAGLMEQVLDLVQPEGDTGAASRDPFEEIVAGLGDVGTSGLAGSASPDLPDVPDSPEELGGRGFGVPAPRDPALDRLFPTADRQDEQAAAEFRRLTEPGLRSRKADNLRLSMTALRRAHRDRVELSEGEAAAMLVALTDVRLVLGERLGLRTDEDAARIDELLEDLDRDDPVAYAIAVYDFLTWLQESLVHALSR